MATRPHDAELYKLLGSLTAKVESLNDGIKPLADVRDDVSKLTERVDHITKNLSDLPQSKQCADDIKDLKERMSEHDGFRNTMLQRVAWVSGAFAVILYGIGQVITYLLKFVHFTPPRG